jgi:citrate lyase beta subunit
MLALRSLFVVSALDADGLADAARSAADAVVVDLARPAVVGKRDEARALAAKHARAIAKTGRPVFARVADTRSHEMEADLDVLAGGWLTAVMLPGVEIPQDVRDADVQIRKREMRLGLTPGGIRLVPEIDSAEGLTALPRILEAVDRHGAVALSAEGLRADLRLGERASGLYDHAMADIALHADTARLPWVLSLDARRPEWAALPAKAHDFGAAGAAVHAEAAVRGMNALFALDPVEVAIARAMLVEWERVRSAGAWTGVVAGEVAEASTTDRLVDRRTVRRARAVVAIADAVERRARVP